eukprot:1098803-Amphidinium_carterae.1
MSDHQLDGSAAAVSLKCTWSVKVYCKPTVFSYGVFKGFELFSWSQVECASDLVDGEGCVDGHVTVDAAACTLVSAMLHPIEVEH